MGIINSKSNKINIKYDLKVIFYGNIPQRIMRDIEHNTEIFLINNEYFFLRKYKWYMYLRLNNQRINTIDNINYIINNKPPSEINPPIVFQKNVLLCYTNINQAMNLVQHYQQNFFVNNNIEDYMPYFIFNESNLLDNNLNDVWKVNILIDEEKDVINIHAVNQKLQIYQTDYFYEDFLKCRIFRNYDNLRDIYERLKQIIERNEYIININNNTEKLELYFRINQRPNDDGNLINLNNEIDTSNSTIDSEIINENEDIKNTKTKTPFRSQKKFIKLKSNKKNI